MQASGSEFVHRNEMNLPPIFFLDLSFDPSTPWLLVKPNPIPNQAAAEAAEEKPAAAAEGG